MWQWILLGGIIIVAGAYLYCKNNACRCLELMGGHCDPLPPGYKN